MGLRIETFSNQAGGNAFFKAVGHPAALAATRRLLRRLGAEGPVAVYDPLGQAEAFAQFHPLDGIDIVGVFVQDVEAVGREVLGRRARPVTELPTATARRVLVACFDAGRAIQHIRHLLPLGAEALSFDYIRIPDTLVTDQERYLSGMNFATNFALFRDQDGHHTRVVSSNYWGGYEAGGGQRLYHCLFDAAGAVLAEWTDPLPGPNATVVIDSRAVRRRFALPEFTGSLFLHVIGAAGHDVVKYALDTYGDDDQVLSCTHDANAWPSDLYAGLPAPDKGERVLLWVQNSHPCPIPAGTVTLAAMGTAERVPYPREIAAFATVAIDVATLLPGLRWPGQIEIGAGKHFVRPRYEVLAADGRRRIAHANVERTDLKTDPTLARIAGLMGKGHILPAPILPPDRFDTLCQPTPMSTAQTSLPVRLLVMDSKGREVMSQDFGDLQRADSVALDVTALLYNAGVRLAGGYGHVELVYDFAAGNCADGWLHALFRYRDRLSGHVAETSFGAHIFNTVLTYRGEPQSYNGRPPGLSTRLFLRLASPGLDTICHLIYPASTPWIPLSATDISLTRADGTTAASRRVAIPCGGSLLFSAKDRFSEAERADAGADAHIVIRDKTCRLFGYHGLRRGDIAFSLDHMFGF